MPWLDVTNYLILSVAGSTSLALLVTRLVVSRVLLPKFNKIDSGTVPADSGSKTAERMDLIIKLVKAFDTVASVFSTLWLIIGGYFVYGCYDIVQFDSENLNPKYCDSTAYYFAFGVITLGCISLVLSVISFVCMLCVKHTDAWFFNRGGWDFDLWTKII